MPALTISIIGLSPLARGTLFYLFDKPFCFRFIPAGAGNTTNTAGEFNNHAVYPRWRGEHAHSRANFLIS
ncbi:hypothetical protein EBL_c30610 [Shimwellia blattae DSM 4481 = NBRC 105725]|uniref:Uncharacterized protein n=1 Tax=Shimwellia blattae (strain ATCC 29907 / DSM 4481 / JCM 1650 / NBRC 105725 / CDC 9005-74) TaxID=630626 RepID=I2BC77_SHIBC|nr:hypothetical protein EBL_c30610 [Shimwellia blattae DSM 4481 = NBRC 105725]